MEVFYNNKLVKQNELLTPYETQHMPQVFLPNTLNKNIYYTLIMYDPDAIHGTHWHWIVNNINVNGSFILLPYKGPSPPDNKKHRYVFELYSQKHKNDNRINFYVRNITLQKGKNLLGLLGNPILKFQFLSEKTKV